ncbi:hypothetical protein J6590_028919 [Homalodisca vitripennis]|nr:hypothetical protein J6590_028919 [Homalodisca vitripennis]
MDAKEHQELSQPPPQDSFSGGRESEEAAERGVDRHARLGEDLTYSSSAQQRYALESARTTVEWRITIRRHGES